MALKKYIVVSFCFDNGEPEIKIINISENIKDSKRIMHDSYSQYLNDDYIVRNVGEEKVLVYKRIKGIFYDSKYKLIEYLICEYNI